jgi:mevalonate pyrophosphate decarboxylase
LNDFDDFRKGKGLKVAYTIDAGPNVHLLYAWNIEKLYRALLVIG